LFLGPTQRPGFPTAGNPPELYHRRRGHASGIPSRPQPRPQSGRPKSWPTGEPPVGGPHPM